MNVEQIAEKLNKEIHQEFPLLDKPIKPWMVKRIIELLRKNDRR